MNILISVPGVSYATFINSRFVNGDSELLEVAPFQPTLGTLDVFPQEMKGLVIPGFWGVGIPHWPMEANGTNGVAGPGLPKDELFVPESIREDMVEVAGKYDKWRPYPCEGEPTQYQRKMARKLSTKRGKFFEHVFLYTRWQTIFWVEHAPTSMAHVDQQAALELSDRILGKALRIIRRKPGATFVYFSPYGAKKEPGFAVSNRLDSERLADWEGIRDYLLGKFD